jgi:tetratricopeptide (TPR) repeat protein
MENIKLLFKLYLRPLSAMSEILDKGNWFFAALLVLLVSVAFFFTVNAKLQAAYAVPDFHQYFQPALAAEMPLPQAQAYHNQALAEYQQVMDERTVLPLVGDSFFKFFSFEPRGFVQPLLALSVFYVPVVILLMSLFGSAGGFGTVFPREYGSLATCSMFAWTAAHLPFAAAGIFLYSQPVSPLVFLAMWAGSSLLFGVLMIFALRVSFGANYGAALLVVGLSWLGLSLATNVFQLVSPLMFSPFLLFFIYTYFSGRLGSEISGYGTALRQKQNFKRFLHNATENPHDAAAHVQLGLIYRQRRQAAKSLAHLRKAVEIDKNEIDANYELGKIARATGNLPEAINHFAMVVEQNDKHALSEIWREIGATYLEAGMLAEARQALEKFIERRPFDAEGLYYLGKALKAKSEHDEARKAFEQAVESVNTSPIYRRREVRYWSKLAQKEI